MLAQFFILMILRSLTDIALFASEYLRISPYSTKNPMVLNPVTRKLSRRSSMIDLSSGKMNIKLMSRISAIMNRTAISN